MTLFQVDQLLHGYRQGHEQIAGSIKLQKNDAELITRLSDLSGSLSGAPKFTSYLTVYPLHSRQYFALARTWPDTEATRSGCVLTHTLIVPLSMWETMEEPKMLDSLFGQPDSYSINEYNCPLALPEKPVSKPYEISEGNKKALTNIVTQYFGDGKRPLVFFGLKDPEELLWKILRGLWPKLRSSFSSCTFCLQPRTLEDHPFELMFAPKGIDSRFHKINSIYLVDPSVGKIQSNTDGEKELWGTAITNHFLGEINNWISINKSDLWTELDEDPTAFRRLYMVEKLMKDSNATPQILVGAMDLVESIAKNQNSAILSKQKVAEQAVQAAKKSKDPNNGLECIRLIEDRLRRQSFSQVKDKVGQKLIDAISNYTNKFTQLTLQQFISSSTGGELNESWYGQGLLHGLRLLSAKDPKKLILLRKVPNVAAYILDTEPEVGAAFIGAIAEQREDQEAKADLLRLLSGIHDHKSRSRLRASLIPQLGFNDVEILAELLKDLLSDEVEIILDALWQQTRKFESSGIHKLVISQFAQGHPVETREWTSRLPQWTPVVAQIFAATYPTTRQGLKELLEDIEMNLSGQQRAESVAAFLQGLGPSRFPYWLTDIAREQPSLLSALLDKTATSYTLFEQTQKLLNEVPNLPIAQSQKMLEKVIECSECPFFSTLLDVTMRNLIISFIAGNVNDVVCRSFQENPYILPWFNSVDNLDLRSLVTRDIRLSSDHLIRAWQWMASAPNALYFSEKTPIPEIIDELLRSHYSMWSKQVSDAWLKILYRGESEKVNKRTQLRLFVQALKFAFDNTHLPLSNFVIVTYYFVYISVIESRIFQSETNRLFGFFDWDKGKELRRKLVDSFMRSIWPAGDIVLAVNKDLKLLRKIFKRLLNKYGGYQYARLALSDIEERSMPDTETLINILRDMIENPDFYEEWY